MWSALSSISKREPTGFVGGLDVGSESEMAPKFIIKIHNLKWYKQFQNKKNV